MCAVKASTGGFFLWFGLFFNKRLEIFTGCDDDDVFVELPK